MMATPKTIGLPTSNAARQSISCRAAPSLRSIPSRRTKFSTITTLASTTSLPTWMRSPPMSAGFVLNSVVMSAPYFARMVLIVAVFSAASSSDALSMIA